MEQTPQVQETRKWEIFLYTFNTVSSNGAMILMTNYMFYAQNVLGLAATVVGAIAMAMRIWDGLTDPVIGLLMDRTNSRFGKFRPFIGSGFALMSITLILMFNTPVTFSTGGKYAYTSLLYFVFVIGYTFQTVSTRAAQAILTKDPKQRPLFGIFQMITNSLVAGMLPFLMTAVMAPRYEGKMLNPQLWKDVVWIYVGVMAIATALAILGIRRRDIPENFGLAVKQKVSFKDTWDVLRHNRPIQMLVVAASTDKLANGIMNGLTIYVFSNLFLNNALGGKFSIIKMIPQLPLCMLLISRARKYGLKRPFVWYTWISIASLVAMFAIGARPETIYVFLFLLFLQQSMSGALNGMINPMIADCADYETYRSGKFLPGIVGTIFTFVDKFVSSFASLFVGLALVAAGVGNAKIPTDQWISNRFYWMVMAAFCVPLILGNLATVIAMKHYTLTREKMAEIQEELRIRKEEAENR